jgi:hypothetical protein
VAKPILIQLREAGAAVAETQKHIIAKAVNRWDTTHELATLDQQVEEFKRLAREAIGR